MYHLWVSTDTKYAHEQTFPVVRIPFQIQKYTIIQATNRQIVTGVFRGPGSSIPLDIFSTSCLYGRTVINYRSGFTSTVKLQLSTKVKEIWESPLKDATAYKVKLKKQKYWNKHKPTRRNDWKERIEEANGTRPVCMAEQSLTIGLASPALLKATNEHESEGNLRKSSQRRDCLQSEAQGTIILEQTQANTQKRLKRENRRNKWYRNHALSSILKLVFIFKTILGFHRQCS